MPLVEEKRPSPLPIEDAAPSRSSENRTLDEECSVEMDTSGDCSFENMEPPPHKGEV